jgi:hypothetical protein
MKRRIEMCKCAMHEAAREQRNTMELTLDASANEETTVLPEDNILLSEDQLGG